MRFVGWDAPLLHCGYPTLSVLTSDREAPRPAPTRLPVWVHWCSMVVLPHTVGCISWSIRHISQKRLLRCKGGHLLCLIYSKVMHSPCRLVQMRRQLLSLILSTRRWLKDWAGGTNYHRVVCLINKANLVWCCRVYVDSGVLLLLTSVLKGQIFV